MARENAYMILNQYFEDESFLNIALNEDNMGSANNEKYIYFSFVSFFSSGYGDIYPISSITRNWATAPKPSRTIN